MTSEKMLEMMMLVYDQLDAEEKKNTDYYLNNQAKEIMSNSFIDSIRTDASLGCTVGEIIRVLKQDIYNTENKKNGKSKQVTVIKSVLKTAKQNNNNTQWHSTYIIDNKQYVLCGYYGFIFNNPVDGVPVASDQEIESSYIKIFQNAKNNDYNIELALPDRSELSAYIKTIKAKRKTMSAYLRKAPIVFNFGENLPMVNAEYLLDVIDTLPNAKLMFYKDHFNAPLYATGSDGESILLPMRKKDFTAGRTVLN